MSLTCTRRLQFCAGHRVYGHESKCANPHGHNYVALIEAEADALDSIGRVIDFSVLKDRVGTWIDQHWDHGFLVYWNDVALHDALVALKGKLYVMSVNPTAENMAHYLLTTVCPPLLSDTCVRVTSVVLYETENCSARADL